MHPKFVVIIYRTAYIDMNNKFPFKGCQRCWGVRKQKEKSCFFFSSFVYVREIQQGDKVVLLLRMRCAFHIRGKVGLLLIAGVCSVIRKALSTLVLRTQSTWTLLNSDWLIENCAEKPLTLPRPETC